MKRILHQALNAKPQAPSRRFFNHVTRFHDLQEKACQGKNAMSDLYLGVDENVIRFDTKSINGVHSIVVQVLDRAKAQYPKTWSGIPIEIEEEENPLHCNPSAHTPGC